MAKKNAIERARELYSQFISGVGSYAQNFNQPRQVTSPNFRPLIQTPLANVKPINWGQVGQQTTNFVQQQVQPRFQQIQQQVPRLVQNVGQQMQKIPDYNFQSPKILGQNIFNTQMANPSSEIVRSMGRTIEKIPQRLQGKKFSLGENIEDISNIAFALPVGKIAKIGKVLAPALEREAAMALNYLKSYDKLTPSAQIDVLGRIANTAKKVIPDVVGSKEVKKLAGVNPTEWRNVMAKFIEDRLVQSKNPKFDMGLSVRTLQKEKPVVRGVKNQLVGNLRQVSGKEKAEQIPLSETVTQKTSLSKSISLPSNIPQGQKERKFIQPVRESKTTKPDVPKQVQG